MNLSLQDIGLFSGSILGIAIMIWFYFGNQIGDIIGTLITMLVIAGTLITAGMMFYIIFQVVGFVGKK